MASIQPNIVDLDDLLIQIVSVNDNGANTTFVTAAPHGISLNDEVVITNCPVNSGDYNATVSVPSSTVIGVANTTSFTIDVTSASTGGAVANTGQVMVDDVVGTNTYYTPEITIDVVDSTFTLNQAGNLAVAGTGVTGQALYSFFKERWKEVPSITKYAFPMLSITNEQFEIQNGWTPADDATRKRIRTAGWSELVGTTINRTYSGVITLGTLGSTDQPYYTQDDSFTAATQTTTFTGPVNEAVPIFVSASAENTIGFTANTVTSANTTLADLSVFKAGDILVISGATEAGNNKVVGDSVTVTAANSTVVQVEGTSVFTADALDAATPRITTDRSGYFQIYVRTRGKTYADANLADIGVTEMTSIVYRFPVSNGNDLNIKTTNDNAFTNTAISSISGDGTTITVDTTLDHGLYAGAPVTIAGASGYDGNYTVAAVTDANTFTISSTTSAGTVNTGGQRLQYVDAMSIKYLPNPATSSGNVRIRGQYSDATTYAQGDVVYDGNAANPNKRWYFWDNASSTSGGTDNTLANSTGGIGASAWTLWSSLALDAHGERQISANTNLYSAFSTIYDLNSGGTTAAATKEIAYEYAQYQLRQTGTIDTGSSRNGDIADPLVYFIGSQLHTYADPDYTIESVSYPSAVYAADIAAVDKNLITFHDYADSTINFPLTVLVTINFNDNLNGDASSKFYAYYTDPQGDGTTNAFGTTTATLVKTDTNADVFGSAYAQSDQRYQFNYAYSQDTTAGRTQDTDTGITIVGIGTTTAQYVVATGTITDAGATISLVSPLERNYSDPDG